MKDKFTSRYEISQKAKDAGCKLPHLTIYPETLLHEWTFTPEEEKKSEYLFILTNAIIQKWLREEHNLHISIYPIKSHWEKDVRDCNMSNDFHASPRQAYSEYNNYEEALEHGLLEALKLIL